MVLKHYNLLIVLATTSLLLSCGMAAKKTVSTVIGGTGKVQWIEPFTSISNYDEIMVTPTKNEIGNLLPSNVKELIQPSIKEALLEKIDTPKKQILFGDEPQRGQLQIDSKIIFFDQFLDDRTLVIRVEFFDPVTNDNFGIFNIVAGVKGLRGNKEILDGLSNGIQKAVKEMKKTAFSE